MLEIDVSTEKNLTTEALYQWNIGQKLQISGLSEAVQLHFCNKKSERALVVKSVFENGLVLVDVPDILLEEPYNITAYGYSGGKTLFEVHIPVIKRTQPDELTE